MIIAQVMVSADCGITTLSVPSFSDDVILYCIPLNTTEMRTKQNIFVKS